MVEKTPQQAAAVQRLRNWAISPEGQRHFRWGEQGDFARCQKFYRDKLPAHMVDGWCANLHKLATGARPGQAPGEKGK